MNLDARSLPNGSILEADVCIIGGGPVGITLARELSAGGRDVLLVESGGESPSAEAEALNEGGQSSEQYAPLSLYRRRILGGSSSIWGGRLVPYDPIDFEARSWAQEASWPIDYAAVKPYFAPATTYCEGGAAEFDSTEAAPGAAPFIQGFDDVELKTTSFERFSAPTDFGKKYGPELSRAANVRVLTFATCSRLEGEDGGRVTLAVLNTLNGNRLSVTANTYIVACGGIETFRLLAASREAHPDRFGGADGPLGRYFMSHIEGNFPRLTLLDPARRIEWGFLMSRDGMYGRRRMTLSAEAQRQRRLLNFIARLHHPSAADPGHGSAVLSAMFLAKSFILAEYRRKISMVERTAAQSMPTGLPFWMAHLRNLTLGAPGLAGFMADWTRRRYLSYRRIPYVVLPSKSGKYPLDFNAEQLPNRLSRVYQTDTLDRFGVPTAGVDWRMTDQDVDSIAGNLRAMQQILARDQVARLDFADDLHAQIRAEATPIGGHHIGTARMSDTARTGIVDGDLKAHGIANLYVAGTAVLPTSSHANPTLTALALALRLADHIRTPANG